MSFVPPDPGRVLETLRATVAALKTLAELHPDEPAYTESLDAAQKAADILAASKTVQAT